MLESQLAGLAAQQAAQVAGLAAPEGGGAMQVVPGRSDEWGWVSLRKKL